MTDEEKTFLMYYRKYMPVIDSDCTMNQVAHYIESIDFNIKQKLRSPSTFDYHILQSSNNVQIDYGIYAKIKAEVETTFNQWKEQAKANSKSKLQSSLSSDFSKNKFNKDLACDLLRERLNAICSDSVQLSDYLLYLFYEDKPSYNKSTLWQLVGVELYQNIRSRVNSCYFPIKDLNGSLEYLYEKYSIQKIPLSEQEQEYLESEDLDING